jgi:hypothetical protein
MYVWYKIETISKFKNREKAMLDINPFYTQKAVDGITCIGGIAAWLKSGML